MWRRVTNSSSVKPLAIDNTVSEFFTYIRKNFEQETITDMDGTERIRWSYLETTVPKDVFEIYEQTVNNTNSIAGNSCISPRLSRASPRATRHFW